MCQLCCRENPFGIMDVSKMNYDTKKHRARIVKDLLISLESKDSCDKGKEEINKLKEEQYTLSRFI